MDSCYKYIQAWLSGEFRLWQGVRKELRIICSLLPLDLLRHWSLLVAGRIVQ